jgi:hypothetical protein
MENLRDIIQQLASDNELRYSVLATVTAVDKSAKTCDCEPLDNSAELLDIRLQADTGKGVTIYPVVGSTVVINYLSKDDGYVAMFSQVETLSIENDTESLKTLLEDILTQMANLKVTTNSGASIEVINKPAILAIKNRLPNLFH